jgi:hypothetical protein
VQNGYFGSGTLDTEMEMSGEDIWIELDENTRVRCKNPGNKGGKGKGNGKSNGNGGGNSPPSPPGLK